jgi:hypothetical protein
MSLAPQRSLAVVFIKHDAPQQTMMDCTSAYFAPLRITDLSEMNRKDVEQKLNRSLSLKDRLTLKLLQRHAKRKNNLGLSATDDCSKMEKKAGNSILFGILGLIIAGIIFGIVAIALGSKARKLAKDNPDCPDAAKKAKKGKIGMILGVIDIIGAVIFLAVFL